MNRDQLLEQIRPLNQPKVDALGPSLAASARATPRAAVEIYLGPDEDASDKAQRLIRGLEDLAVVPLVEAPSTPSAERRAWMITAGVEAELALRQRLIARIDKLLDDKSPLPVTSAGPVERPLPRKRVCDQAYLLMRRIVHFGEAPADAAAQADLFLNAPDGFRDAQIKKARASQVWNRAITGKDIDEYEGPASPLPKSH